MARTFANALRLAGDAQLVAVASRDVTRAREFAQQTGAHDGGFGYDELLTKSDIDVVYVATPNHRHKADCLSALCAGKAVLCEKPLAINASDAREIAEAARQAGLFCMEAMWTHLIPAVTELESLVRSGAIGVPVMMTASFGLPNQFDSDSWLFSTEHGGGALLDRGCYPISLALRILGEVREVRGSWRSAPSGADETAGAVITFAGGAIALIGASLSGYLSNDLIVTGTLGRLVLHEPITCPSWLSLRKLGSLDTTPPSFARHDRRTKWRTLLQHGRLVTPLRFLLQNRFRFVGFRSNGFIHEIEEVHRCLRSGALESRILPLALSVDTLSVIDSLRSPSIEGNEGHRRS